MIKVAEKRTTFERVISIDANGISHSFNEKILRFEHGLVISRTELDDSIGTMEKKEKVGKPLQKNENALLEPHVLDDLHQGYFELGYSGEFLYINKKAKELFKLPAESSHELNIW